MLLSDADVGIQPQPSPQIPANPLSPSQTPTLTAKTQPKLLSDADVGMGGGYRDIGDGDLPEHFAGRP